jgi:hypothetical protein
VVRERLLEMLLAPILGEEEEEGYVDIDGLYKR